ASSARVLPRRRAATSTGTSRGSMRKRIATTRKPAYRSLQIVQAVAGQPERGLVVTAVDRDGPGRVLDCCGRLSERHHLPAVQQPAQAGLVVAAQACVAGVRLRW